jgi:hypothetical protein
MEVTVPCDRCHAPRVDLPNVQCGNCGFNPSEPFDLVMLQDNGLLLSTIGETGLRGETGHLMRTQYWAYGGTTPVIILLAHGPLSLFDNNSSNFYFKHILHATKKTNGPTSEQKLFKRHEKRNLTPKNKEKLKPKEGQLSVVEKYGSDRAKGGFIPDNTAIDLSLISMDEVRGRFYTAIMTANWSVSEEEVKRIKEYFKKKGTPNATVWTTLKETKIKVDFGRACVLQVGKTNKTYDHVWVSVRRSKDSEFPCFSVYHLDYDKMT